MTVRYIRKAGQWIKITRDSKKRTFTFARGYESNLTAHVIKVYSFTYINSWVDAVDFAEQIIDTYS